MNKLTVHGTRPYQIIIDKGLRHSIEEWLKPFQFNQIAIVTDEQVAPLYLLDLKSQLSQSYDVFTYLIPEGEQSKNINQFESMITFLSENYFDRHSAIIALGGGVTGDLAGFVASSYMRGIGFVQMPTTLLAHDSSVGGKVAINHHHIKNIIGHFYSPDLVLYDYEMLDTLSSLQFRSGFAEVVKHSYLKPDPLYKMIAEVDDFTQLTSHEVENILTQSILVKKQIIEQDEYEQDMRQVLNLGHTLGHAIESVYSEYKVTHGEAVMIGILFDLYLSDHVHKRSDFFFHEELLHWLTTLGYSLTLTEWKYDSLIQAMKHDKKNQTGNITCILLENIGKPYAKTFSISELNKLLINFVEQLNQNKHVKILT
ncbi:3-dehydroquinate synthase [Alkalibacillus almallahensis]|uniref:3-dehydroquinate synthase n=1 Tax=Alkalibacillus almallahensis TaxID=1379154 RepID=UPI001420508D|nr:3-dehydroquinate synthase [Alkalibacillus almallahensis]NIK12302.1 3-dehydroquinate synthase [Alkalibacillus almallahensis]